MVTLQDLLNEMSPAERQAHDRRVASLIQEHKTLLEFRPALVCAREVIAEGAAACPTHGPVPQDPNETILGLLHQCVEAMGGRYSLIVELPGRPPLALTDFEVADDEFHERGAVYHELTTLKDDWLDRARSSE